MDRLRKLRLDEITTRKHSPYGWQVAESNPRYIHARTDELGYGIASVLVDVNDFNATLLQLLGLNHEKLTYRAFGLDQRLTGVEEHHVVREVLA